MHEAVRNVEPARSIARRPAPPAGTSPRLLGVPQSPRVPLPPPRRVDPREAFRAAKAPASTHVREPYLIGIAAFAAAGATALALLSSGAVGLPFRSAAPAIAEAGLWVTAVDLAREARELRELSRAAAAATAPAADRNSKESGPAPSSPSQQTSDKSSPGPGEIAGDEDDPTPLDDSTALLEDSANELGGAANQLLEDSTTHLEDTTQPVLEEAESLELDPSLP
jgi:hypothetical protein